MLLKPGMIGVNNMDLIIHCYDCDTREEVFEIDDDFIKEHHGHKISIERADMDSYLDPCPWCGETDYIEVEEESNGKYSVSCTKCLLMLGANIMPLSKDSYTYTIKGIFNSYKEAIEAWNYRSK